MPTSIALVPAWDYPKSHASKGADPLPVREHQWLWKYIDSETGGTSCVAEVIAWSSDHWMFASLHGTLAKNTNFAPLIECGVPEEYDGILPVLREMADQHPDAMWFVG